VSPDAGGVYRAKRFREGLVKVCARGDVARACLHAACANRHPLPSSSSSSSVFVRAQFVADPGLAMIIKQRPSAGKVP
jgi:hypothetical protein